jgi:hypothetical protein
MRWVAIIAALLLTGNAPPPRGPLTASQPAPAPIPERIPIDLGPDAPSSEPPQQIDILAPPVESELATEAVYKECEEQRERGVVAGEIVVCRELAVDTSQLYSGSREAWLKDYAERTQNAGTIAPPDVAGPGIFRGPATVGGLCFIGPCPEDPALIIDVEAIPPPPEGSDAERVAQGLVPLEGDDAALSNDSRDRLQAELGLPEVGEAAPQK